MNVGRLRPVAQAAAGLQAITPTQVLVLATVEVQLVAHDQAGTAAFGQAVVTLHLVVALGVFGQDRNQGIFQAVVHRQQLLRALGLTPAQRYALLEIARPGIAFTGLDGAVADISEVNEGDAIVAR
ncbi:hypothetical protein D9M71_806700 [compost metagenome]